MQTRFSSVVLPAFALPITRIRKWVYLARSFAASFGSVVIVDTVGARSAGDKGPAGGAATIRGEATAGGNATVRGEATTAGGEFEPIGGVLCDPRPNSFFRALRNPLDSLAVCGGRWSAISRRRQELRLTWVIRDNESPIYRTP